LIQFSIHEDTPDSRRFGIPEIFLLSVTAYKFTFVSIFCFKMAMNRLLPAENKRPIAPSLIIP